MERKNTYERGKEDNKYFAAKPADEVAQIVLARAHQYNNITYNSGYIEKMMLSYAAYHGMDYYESAIGHQIRFTGEQGELIQCKVNHFRNIADNMINLITASRPAMEARSVNTDSKSVAQTKLANGLLDYYMREKRLEDILNRATTYGVVLGSGWVKMAWNATAGEKVEPDTDPDLEISPETQAPIYEGDIEFTVLSPFDVLVDSTKENQKHDWVNARTFKNKFDIAAKYPEHRDRIEALKTKSELEKTFMYIFGMEDTSDVPVYEFYHNRTESMPDGRYILYLEGGIVLYDGPLPYRKIPLYRVSPSDILGTPYGYTPMFDLIPLQDALDMTYSTILSNQNAFGVQSLLVPSNSNITMESLSSGLNFIECDFTRGKPEAINFTNTPKEVFDFLGLTIQQMETISGINSVIRGNPEASLRTGSSLALVQSNAIQFMSKLAQQYNQLIEDVGTGLIDTLKIFATTKRVAAIVGINNRSYLQSFTGDDLANISRVSVVVANPLSKSTAGKMQIASELLQYQLLDNPKQYLQILQTGSLDIAIDDNTKILNEIQSENEALLNGEKPVAIILDQQRNHIAQHKALVGDFSMRKDPVLLKNTLDHIQEHIDILFNEDPNIQRILAMTGEQLPEMAQKMQMLEAQQQMPPMPAGAPEMPMEEQLAPPTGAPSAEQAPLPQPAQKLPKAAGNPNAPVTPEQLQQSIRG
jgi:hypothetical protein